MMQPPTVQAGGFVVSGVAQAAPRSARAQAGVMTPSPPVVIYPPDETGGRRVRIDGTISGLAYSARDVAAFMQEAGLQNFDEVDVARSPLIEWRGGGPDVWAH